jgi:hypothetical protein
MNGQSECGGLSQGEIGLSQGEIGLLQGEAGLWHGENCRSQR